MHVKPARLHLVYIRRDKFSEALATNWELYTYMYMYMYCTTFILHIHLMCIYMYSDYVYMYVLHVPTDFYGRVLYEMRMGCV